MVSGNTYQAREEGVTVYNFEVEGGHTYVVAGERFVQRAAPDADPSSLAMASRNKRGIRRPRFFQRFMRAYTDLYFPTWITEESAQVSKLHT